MLHFGFAIVRRMTGSSMLGFLRARAIPGVEVVEERALSAYG